MHEFSDHKQAKFAVAITSHRKHRELLQSVLKETIIYKAGETDMTRFLLAKDYENPNESHQKTTPNHMMLITGFSTFCICTSSFPEPNTSLLLTSRILAASVISTGSTLGFPILKNSSTAFLKGRTISVSFCSSKWVDLLQNLDTKMCPLHASPNVDERLDKFLVIYR